MRPSSSPSSSSSSSSSDTGSQSDSTLAAHMSLLSLDDDNEDIEELAATPIFTQPVLRYGSTLEVDGTVEPFTQYGLLAGIIEGSRSINYRSKVTANERLYFNTTAPSSIFICGSQGSGKSHTLGCLLENCLMQSEANVLPRPLTGIVFHYDHWVSASRGSPCEAAYLASAEDVSVRVLCPPTNVKQIQRIYSRLPDVQVEVLRINQSDLNTKRMMDLMAVSSVQGGMPLYLHVVQRILRDLRIEQQTAQTTFNYREFKKRLMDEPLTPAQLQPLQQRLETLESFMVKEQVVLASNKRAIQSQGKGTDWKPKPGQLTIIDLSCPCVTEETACSLFNICLSLFLEQSPEVGRVVALDEAHKYMTETAECEVLTEALLSNIRLQRHLGLRVMISTQEPTISPKLLDLCSVTIVHRFTSPDWLQSLKKHLAGASIAPMTKDQLLSNGDDKVDSIASPDPNDLARELFSKIVALRRGEALLFSPSAIIDVRTTTIKSENGSPRKNGWHDAEEPALEEAVPQLIKLSHGHMKIRVRKRVTQDGGRSILAV
ncbi:p-loop containing nucleoside triphosphate hydrolase [Trichoderma arundinaceum]|uniref:p-loop containing nucleoside triphosphate hydrolase n=1 Tax=Trichoderma arundinaceum TaxID=490622 RepID=A0A395NLU7_TRIAR|nr:p-loop containing nucleoside triphosphate hydrolase [Trichoderma arundinaceum]